MNKKNAAMCRVCVFLPLERNIAVSFAVRRDPKKPKLDVTADMSRARTYKE